VARKNRPHFGASASDFVVAVVVVVVRELLYLFIDLICVSVAFVGFLFFSFFLGSVRFPTTRA